MRDHSHSSPDETGICTHCGQPLPVGHGHAHAYGEKRVSSTGLIITVALHVLLLLAFMMQKQLVKLAPPAGGSIAYIAPLDGKPKKKESAKAEPKVAKHHKPVVMNIQRLPNTITLPNEKPVPVAETPPEPPKIDKLPPEEDMAAAIEARRRARGQASEQQGEETDKDRGTRLALANIAAANGRGQGNDSGGMFDYSDKTFNSAQLKFRGWNPSFNRRWLTQVHVELGTERDIETAIVKKMIELIRKEKKGDFDWESHRLQRVVKMSARVEDQAELEAFLLKEMFPNYTQPRTR